MQKIGIIRLNRLLYIIIQISLVKKKGNTVEAFYEAYVENGEVHLKKNEEEAYGDTRVSTSKINELSKKAVNEHFSNVYAGLATF